MNNNAVPLDPAGTEDAVLRFEVGDLLSPGGLTRVTLDGKGHFRAEQMSKPGDYAEDTDRLQEKLGTPDPVEGSVEKGDAAGLIDRAGRFPWGRKFPSRPGIPDEAIVAVQLELPGGASKSLKIWLREAEQDKSVSPVLRVLRDHLSRFSKGKMVL